MGKHMPARKAGARPMNKHIHICRNPYGFSVHEQREARLSLCYEVEQLQARVAELNEEIGHLEDRVISQGQQLREIVNITKGPPVDKMHSTHDAVATVARLKAISDNAIRAKENL